MRSVRLGLATASLCVALFSLPAGALDGMVISTSATQMYATGALTLKYLSSGETKTLFDAGVYGPSFSPDGRFVVAPLHKNLKVNLTVVGIDGVVQRTLVAYSSVGSPQVKEPYATWAEDGYVYWSNCDKVLRRIKADGSSNGKMDSIHISNKNIHNLSVSMDGKRAVWTCPPPDKNGAGGWSNRTLDLVSGEMYESSMGCQSSVSPDGQWITKSSGSHTISYIYRWDDRNAQTYNSCGNESVGCDWFKAIITGIVPEKHFMIRWARQDERYLLYTSEPPINGYLYETKETKVQSGPGVFVAPGMIWDYFPNEIRSTQPQGGFTLGNSSLLFSVVAGQSAAGKTITVTNTAAGTNLGALTITKKSSWLTVAVQGTGNAQTLVNTINATTAGGVGSYNDTVSVTDPATGASAVYTVSLDITAPADNPVVIHSPVGGEQFLATQPLTLRYSADCQQVPSVRLMLSPGDEDVWIDVSLGTSRPCGDNQSMTWTTLSDLFNRYPGVEQFNPCRIQVINYNGAENAVSEPFVLLKGTDPVINNVHARAGSGALVEIVSQRAGETTLIPKAAGLLTIYDISGRRLAQQNKAVPLQVPSGTGICIYRFVKNGSEAVESGVIGAAAH